MTLGTVEKTERGFAVVRFFDSNGNECRVQQSSAIDDTEEGFYNPGTSFLWLGVVDANPKILASKAEENGIEKTQENGWQPYFIPNDVLLTTEMHLNREQVSALVETLQGWLENGELK